MKTIRFKVWIQCPENWTDSNLQINQLNSIEHQKPVVVKGSNTCKIFSWLFWTDLKFKFWSLNSKAQILNIRKNSVKPVQTMNSKWSDEEASLNSIRTPSSGGHSGLYQDYQGFGLNRKAAEECEKFTPNRPLAKKDSSTFGANRRTKKKFYKLKVINHLALDCACGAGSVELESERYPLDGFTGFTGFSWTRKQIAGQILQRIVSFCLQLVQVAELFD